MKKLLATGMALCFLGIAVPSFAAPQQAQTTQQDQMKKDDGMTKDSGMAKTDAMKHDDMSKDGMAKDKSKKKTTTDAMKKDDNMKQDDMKKDDNMKQDDYVEAPKLGRPSPGRLSSSPPGPLIFPLSRCSRFPLHRYPDPHYLHFEVHHAYSGCMESSLRE